MWAIVKAIKLFFFYENWQESSVVEKKKCNSHSWEEQFIDWHVWKKKKKSKKKKNDTAFQLYMTRFCLAIIHELKKTDL